MQDKEQVFENDVVNESEENTVHEPIVIEDHETDFQRVPSGVIRRTDLGGDEKLLLSFIIYTSENGPGCLMSNAGLAKKYGAGLSRVKRWIRKLKKLKLIRITGPTNRRRIYSNVTLQKIATTSEKEGVSVRVKSEPELGSNSNQHGSKMNQTWVENEPHKGNKEKKRNNKETNISSDNSPLDSVAVDQAFEAAWKEYGKKGNRMKAIEAWNSLDENARKKVKSSISIYLDTVEDKKYQHNFENYIQKEIYVDHAPVQMIAFRSFKPD